MSASKQAVVGAKPTVKYRKPLLSSIFVGGQARVVAVDHPNFAEGTPVLTSTIVKHDPATGEFETRNTLYVPEQLPLAV